jgi:predicted nuclease of predicted toxin-antitoxin system
MAKLYSNENFPLPVVERLRSLGHDVVTIQETGKADQAMPDREVLAFAIREGRAVLTLNRLHFIRLHQQDASHSGIIVCTFDLDFEGQARRIHEAITSQGNLHGQLLRVNRTGSGG